MQRLTTFAALLLFVCLIAHCTAHQGAAQSTQPRGKLYFFTNPGCGPCRLVEPELEKLYREGFPVMKIDTTVHPDWTGRFQVTRTPTVVMVVDQQVIARHSGMIDAETMRGWFRSVESAAVERSPRGGYAGSGSKGQINQQAPLGRARQPIAASQQTQTGSGDRMASIPSASTTQGTRTPNNAMERIALQATVRLKVDDPEGSSFATGTVIHSTGGEALVLTCGHVFRDSAGQGQITAEYGFLNDKLSRAAGELLFYDADDRDVGLVAISTDGSIEPVTVAQSNFPIQTGDQIISVGCDHGEPPTIRRSRVKSLAKYDGVAKYEIFGRPVSGRSGGGMFTAGGQLVGVCNAAVVTADEGVYAALDSIHWQLAQVNLTHLFSGDAAIAKNHGAPRNTTVAVSAPRNANARRQDEFVAPWSRGNDANAIRNATLVDVNPRSLDPMSRAAANTYGDNSTELIMVLRSKNDTGHMDSWMVENPSPELIQQLKQMGGTRVSGESPERRMARLRRNMPQLRNEYGQDYKSQQMRAQSPR